MKAKTKVLLTSLMSVALASSLIAGATYALFTSEAKTNIAVTSGTVKVSAAVNEESFVLTSMGKTQEGTTWTNGGTVSVSEGTLTLDRMTPGDKVEFNIDVTNESNVAIKYRTTFKEVADAGLLSGLKVVIDEETFVSGSSVTSWKKVDSGDEIDSVLVSIELPEAAGNEYQNKTTDLEFTVEAIQGNATVYDVEIPEGFTAVETSEQLVEAVKEGGDIYLTSDIAIENNIEENLNKYIEENGRFPETNEEVFALLSSMLIDNDVNVDLGGHTLTTNNIIMTKGNVKFSNGIIKEIDGQENQTIFVGTQLKDGDNINFELDSVDIICSDTAVGFDSTRDSVTNNRIVADVNISIKNCNIGAYVFARDNSERANWTLTIENSVIDDSVLYFHANGSIKNSTINSYNDTISSALEVSTSSVVTVENTAINWGGSNLLSARIIGTPTDARGNSCHVKFYNCTFTHDPKVDPYSTVSEDSDYSQKEDGSWEIKYAEVYTLGNY